MRASGFTDQGSVPLDRLIAGGFPRIEEKVAVAGGTALKRGALLGRVTASGAYTLSLAAAEDGSEEPVAILAQDTAADDTEALVYRTGEFNEAAVIYGTGHTAATVRDALAALQVWLRRTVPA